jgi:hypothetical protein
MSTSTTDVGGTTKMTTDIVGLVQTTENIVDMIETMKDMNAALKGDQESRKTWTDTGIVLSLSTAGTQE